MTAAFQAGQEPTDSEIVDAAPCVYCRAVVGSSCVTPSGDVRRPHADRVDKFLRKYRKDWMQRARAEEKARGGGKP